MSNTKEELRQLIIEKAHKEEGYFRTPAGVITDYFDFFKISLKHQGIKLAGELVYDEIKDLQICALGGPGHPVSSVLCRAAYLKEIGVFYIRDTMRKNGDLRDPKWIESRIKEGDRVALVGDVVTSGSELIRALEEVIQFGAFIVKVIIIIDSSNGEALNNILNFARLNQMDNCPVTAIYTRDEIVNGNHE